MKKRWWLAAIAIGIIAMVIAVSSFGLFERIQESKIDSRELLIESLEKTAASKSFRYSLESALVVEGRRELISKVEGEKSSEGNIHIKGEMVKTQIDIYHFDDAIYNWDPFSKRWMVIKDDQTNSSKVLISELDPLSNFNFKSIGEVQNAGWETVDGRRCMIVNCKPSVENELMEVLWQAFEYSVCIDIKDKVIRRASLSGTSKNNSETFLRLQVAFHDFDKKIIVNKPEI